MQLQSWFATSPFASALRAAAGLGLAAALDWLTQNITSTGLPVVVQVAIVAATPPLLRALNKADGTWGRSGLNEAVIKDADEEPAA